MAYQHILVSTEGGITTVTLNRPDKRNALSLPLMLELTEALHDVGRSTAEVRLAGFTAAASCQLSRRQPRSAPRGDPAWQGNPDGQQPVPANKHR